MDALLRLRLLGGPWPGGAEEAAAAGQVWARSDDSGARAKQLEHGDGTVRLSGGGAGRGGAEVHLLRLGRLE
jgi:hypothetical protein